MSASEQPAQKILAVTREPQDWGKKFFRGCDCDSIGKIFRHVCGRDRAKKASRNFCCGDSTCNCHAKAKCPLVVNGERL